MASVVLAVFQEDLGSVELVDIRAGVDSAAFLDSVAFLVVVDSRDFLVQVEIAVTLE